MGGGRCQLGSIRTNTDNPPRMHEYDSRTKVICDYCITRQDQEGYAFDWKRCKEEGRNEITDEYDDFAG